MTTKGRLYVLRAAQHDTQVELCIDKGDSDANAYIFEALARHREAVDETFGAPLLWQKLETKQACRIRDQVDEGGGRDTDRWPALIDATVDAMVRLERALRPHVRSLKGQG